MHKIILATAALVTFSAGAAFAESPNLDNQSLRSQTAVEVGQGGAFEAGATSFGLSNPDVAGAAFTGEPVGQSREATEQRQFIYGN